VDSYCGIGLHIVVFPIQHDEVSCYYFHTYHFTNENSKVTCNSQEENVSFEIKGDAWPGGSDMYLIKDML
jgi:hypothetical protein